MKIESQIRQKLKQVLFRHRKEFVRERLQRRPENCKHNEVVHLPQVVSSRGEVRVCSLVQDGEWNNRVCDMHLGGERLALQCPYYACMSTAQALKEEFHEKVGLGSRTVEIGVVAKDYPDVAALMWVLAPSAEDGPTALSFFGEEEEGSDGEAHA